MSQGSQDVIRGRIDLGDVQQELRSLAPDVLIVVALLVAGWKLTAGLESGMDIVLSDESYYLYQGVELATKGLPVAEQAPLYALWYYFLSFWTPGRIGLFYLNFQTLTILLPAALYVPLRRYHVPILESAVIAFFFLVAKGNLPTDPKVYHFALLLTLIFFVVSSMAKSLVAQLAWLSIGALSVSYVRPELFVAFVLFAVLLLGAAVLEFKKLRFSPVVVLLPVLLISWFFVSLFGLPIGSGGRSFLAFGQHFSINWVNWTGSKLSPWTDWEQIVQQNFGNVHSIAGALAANPVLFSKHIATNIIHLPKYLLLDVFFDHLNIVLPYQFETLEAFLFLGALAFYLFVARAKWRPALKERFRANQRLMVFIGCYLFASLVTVIAIFPRYHYLFFMGTMLTLAMGILLASGNSARSPSLRQSAVLGFVIIGLTPHAVAYPAFSGAKSNEDAIQFIRSMHVGAPVNLLEAQGGLHIYLGDNFNRVADYEKNESFDAFRVDRQINMIVVTDNLQNDIRFSSDPEWKTFLKDYVALGYIEKDIPGTPWQLIVARELLR